MTLSSPSQRVILILVGLSVSGADSASAHDSFSVTFRPVVGPEGTVSGIQVREEIDRSGSAKPLDLSLSEVLPGVPELPGSILDLSVSADGKAAAVMQSTSRDVEGADWHHWQSNPLVGRHVLITYHAEVRPLKQSGPPFAIKAAGAGVGGNTSSFLLVPQGLSSRESFVRWDLSSLPKDSIGALTAGRGDRVVAGSPDRLRDQWLIAGPVAARHDAKRRGFKAYLIGSPPFGARDFIDWTSRAYDTLSARFAYLGTPKYTLLVRTISGPSYATGTAAEKGGGSLVTVGSEYHLGQDLSSVRAVTFHEMTHNWVGHSAPDMSWFSEGLTVFFSTTLPCQAGLVSDRECASAINQSADAYYKSEARNWSQQRIDASPFSEEDVRTVPYGRGMLYFAGLNADIMAKSRGKRDLLAAVGPLFTARRNGKPLDIPSFEAMLRAELGESAVAEFRQIVIEGTMTVAPASRAFGPRLHRVPVHYGDSTSSRSGFHWEVEN